MPRMTTGELKALLAAERYDALSAMMASKLSDERATALNYYMGDMSKDMPRSSLRHHRRSRCGDRRACGTRRGGFETRPCSGACISALLGAPGALPSGLPNAGVPSRNECAARRH